MTLQKEMGKGTSASSCDCVDARLLQRALFPRNPQSASARPGLPLVPRSAGVGLGGSVRSRGLGRLARGALPAPPLLGVGKAKCARARVK